MRTLPSPRRTVGWSIVHRPHAHQAKTGPRRWCPTDPPRPPGCPRASKRGSSSHAPRSRSVGYHVSLLFKAPPRPLEPGLIGLVFRVHAQPPGELLPAHDPRGLAISQSVELPQEIALLRLITRHISLPSNPNGSLQGSSAMLRYTVNRTAY